MSIAPYSSKVRRVQALFGLAALFALAIPAARAQSEPASSQTTLQIQAPLVLEDVVVLDSHNQPVHGLKASDFTVTDDGQRVTPRSFEEHAAPSPAQLASRPRQPNLGVNVFTNYTPTPPDSTLNVLVLDLLNTPPNDQAHVRQKMFKFLAAMPAGRRMAIFGLSAHLYLLQGFTSDPALLRRAVEATLQQSKVQPVNLQPNITTNGANLEQEGADSASLLAEADPDLEGFVGADSLLREGDREQITIATIDQLAHYLAALPGRKNLIWCSGQFPLKFIIPAVPQHPETYHNFSDQIRSMNNLLARSQVSMYPIDATGLVTNPDDDAMMLIQHAPVGGGPRALGFLNQTVDDHAPMEQVAEQTGGKAFFNSDDPTLDAHGKKEVQASAMQAAMMHGTPQPSELLFDVRVVPADGTTTRLSPGSQPNPRLMQPPYRTFTLDTLLDIHNMQMTRGADGKYQGTLDFSLMVYDSDGNVINAKARTVHSNLSPAQYAELLTSGVTASPAIEVPAKGTYFIRIGIRDEATNRIGAVEIPVAALESRQAMILASTRAPANR